MNKTDLVKTESLHAVEKLIRKINPYTKIIKTSHCSAPLKEILNLIAISLERVLEVEPDFLDSDHDHKYDDDVTSVSYIAEHPLNLEKFQQWFGELLRTCRQDILHSKTRNYLI